MDTQEAKEVKVPEGETPNVREVIEDKPRLVPPPTPSVSTGDDDILSLSEIENVNDVQYKKLHIPEWKGSIRLGSLSAGEVLDFIELNDGPAKKNAGFRLIERSLVDKDGKRIGNAQNTTHWRAKNSQVVNRIVDEILTLNGMNRKAAEEGKNA